MSDSKGSDTKAESRGDDAPGKSSPKPTESPATEPVLRLNVDPGAGGYSDKDEFDEDGNEIFKCVDARVP